MSNVIPLRTSAAGASELERRLAERFGISASQLQAAIRPLFLLMHDYGISEVSIRRGDMKAVVTIDGESL